MSYEVQSLYFFAIHFSIFGTNTYDFYRNGSFIYLYIYKRSYFWNMLHASLIDLFPVVVFYLVDTGSYRTTIKSR